MKQQTNGLMRIRIGTDLSLISKVEFVFTQTKSGAPLKTAEYPGDGTMLIEGNLLGVAWTPAETMLFLPDKPFYVDTRITLTDSGYNPPTEIATAYMSNTLFEEAPV